MCFCCVCFCCVVFLLRTAMARSAASAATTAAARLVVDAKKRSLRMNLASLSASAHKLQRTETHKSVSAIRDENLQSH